MSHHIVIIPGDGIGVEITAVARQVLEKTAAKAGLALTFEEKPAGGTAIDKMGVPLPEETLAAARQADAVLLGAVGGPAWDQVAPELRPERAILGLRKALGLYANLRPVKVSPALADYSPLKPELVAGVDILIVRELNGGIYYGEKGSEKDRAWDTEVYSAMEVERIVAVACQAAKVRRGKVTSVDKANVLATSRLWRQTAGTVAAKFTDINLDHLYVDNCAMQLVLAPRQFDVIVTSNLFGDILSDEAAVLTGSIGLLPSASIGDGTGLYEPIHGSAPDIAGRGIANPIGTVLSAAMLLRHSLGEDEAACRVEQAVEAVLKDGYRTADLYRPGFTKVSTMEMGRQILDRL
ncbi:isocitrate and isopropylmalate dehydrogenases signature [Lucifera butyrica]|uniref:3-isopropylmalate dehydrogenase n=1 Tax=Lucifera butyrica TaxID=1351585 RepID=A0A498R658_9FIRM|nr:3-isopropylmalate dehydrogenase [Lucifera butyrica]VBB06891.1 isocitrate and isopropylmalate dehydrogenases signature [Lucifera butyrica]